MIDRIKGIINVEWEKIKPIQPDDVKINTNINALKKSLKNHGFSLPFAVWKDDNVIYCVDGHTRVKALKELKHEGEDVPDKLKAFEIEAKDRKEAVQILVEVFNQKHNAFDNEVLTRWLEVEDVEIQDLEAVNLSSPIIEKNEAQEDDFEIHDEIKTDIKLGDLIEIGKHRLMCGDSTDSDSVAKLMNGEKADMVFTDPPYGVDYKGINNDNRSGLKDLLEGAFSNYILNSKNGASVYCFHSDKCADIFNEVFRNYCHFSSMIIWVKESIVLSQTDYQSKHEPCFYGWFDNGTHKWYSDRKQESVWIAKSKREEGHTTPKPIEIVSKGINNSSETNHLILDLFLGSGSTMVASHQLKRKCYGMELDPKYCQVIIDRMLNSYPDIEVKINGHKYQQLLTV